MTEVFQLNILEKINFKINYIQSKIRNSCSKVKAVYYYLDKRYYIKKYHLMDEEYWQFKFYKKNKAERLLYIRDYEIINDI